MPFLNLPIGSIIAWENLAVPSGWAVCNGASGTPNLVDQFILGASVDGDIRSPGGALTHVHANPNTDTRPVHNHGGTKNFSVGSGGNVDTTTGSGVTAASSGHTHTVGIDIAGADSHSHTIGNTGSTTSLPRYIYRVFIRRIS